MSDGLTTLLTDIRSCTVCERHLPLGANPVLRANPTAQILLISQAPGIKVHATGIPWNDVSGDRLRDWLGVDRETFYSTQNFSIMGMGFCYPGKGKSGDLPPRPECAPLWHTKVRAFLPNLKLTILIGSYALRYYLPEFAGLSVRDLLLKTDFDEAAYLPLVHPSPRNKLWLKQNPWFESGVIPQLRLRMRKIIALRTN